MKLTRATAPWPHAAETEDLAVEPLRRLEDVAAVKDLLADRPRDLLLFLLGVNNGLRAGDLLRVTVNQIRAAGPGDTVRVREKRTRGESGLFVPVAAHGLLTGHLAALKPPSPPADMYLFAGHQGWSPLTVQRVDELVGDWARAVGLSGRYGAHTLRKTFGYLQRTRYGVDLEILARRLGQPSAAATRHYLGLTDEGTSEPRLTEL